MTDTPLVQSGETPESPPEEWPDLEEQPLAVRLRLIEERLCEHANHLDDLVRLTNEIHAMSSEAYQLMNSPAVNAMRKFTGSRGPLLGGRRG